MTIKTLEQARALPEIKSTLWLETTRVLDQDEGLAKKGDAVIDRRPREMSPMPLDGDSIAFFADADGRTMRVAHTVEDGWCKIEERSWP